MTNELQTGKRILVVDDSPDLRSLLSMGLTKANYEPVEAENGIDAQDALRDQGHFDGIILDLQMPLMNGFQFLKWLRNEARNRVPVLVYCSLDPDEQGADLAARVNAAGADAVLFKPVRLPVVIQVLSKIIRVNLPLGDSRECFINDPPGCVSGRKSALPIHVDP